MVTAWATAWAGGEGEDNGHSVGYSVGRRWGRGQWLQRGQDGVQSEKLTSSMGWIGTDLK